jgi:hypothetical protein
MILYGAEMGFDLKFKSVLFWATHSFVKVVKQKGTFYSNNWYLL